MIWISLDWLDCWQGRRFAYDRIWTSKGKWMPFVRVYRRKVVPQYRK